MGADGEVGGRCAGVSGRGGESAPDSLVCGRGAAISDSAAKLGFRGLVGASYASEQMPPGSPPAATSLKPPTRICLSHLRDRSLHS